MDEPRSELTADAAELYESPDLDALTSPQEIGSGERILEAFFDAVLGLDSPATASEVADLAGHGVDAAREYLEWFERLGIVTQVTDSPVTYKRNQAYLNWRRVQSLRTNYTTKELLDLLETETERVETLAGEFDARTPDEVSIAQSAAATGQSVAEVWELLSAWKTARRRIALLERALTTESGDAADLQSAV